MPHCFLVYAHAPEGMLPSDVNRLFNEFVDDRSLPLVIFHDHFIGTNQGALRSFIVKLLKNAKHVIT